MRGGCAGLEVADMVVVEDKSVRTPQKDRRWGYISVVGFGEGPEVRHWLADVGRIHLKDANFIRSNDNNNK